MLFSNKYVKLTFLIFLILLISMLVAIPTTLATMDNSMKLAENIYRNIAIVFKLDSPGKVEMDENGIPYVDYGYRQGVYIGLQRNPLFVANQAIQYYDEYHRTGELEYKEKTLNCLGWLISSKIESGNTYLWMYDFPNTGYENTYAWYSSLAQIRIIDAFTKGYQLTGDDSYKQLAERALLALDTPIAEGGLMYPSEDGEGKWYAEVVSYEREKPPFILNGHMEVLIYLNDYQELTGSKLAQSLFDAGVFELKKHISGYDTGYWTYYDREGNLAYDYHYTHIEEVADLYQITGDKAFNEYYEKWSSYFPVNPLWARKRFAAYLLNFAILSSLSLIVLTSLRLIKGRNRREQQLVKNETNL